MYDNQFEYPLIFREHHGEYYVIETPEALVKHWPKLKDMGQIEEFVHDGGYAPKWAGDPAIILDALFDAAETLNTAEAIITFFKEWSLHDECSDENLSLVWKRVLD